MSTNKQIKNKYEMFNEKVFGCNTAKQIHFFH